MGIGTIASAAAGYFAGQEQADAAREAGAASYDIALKNLQFQKQQYADARADTLPYRQVGAGSINRLSEIFLGTPIAGIDEGTGAISGGTGSPDYSGFYASPSYQFVKDEGIRAMDRSAAARGGLRGGGYGRELTRYAEGLASTEFNNYANRLAALAGYGQNATSTVVGAGMNTANNVNSIYGNLANSQANAIYNAGAATASSYVSAANALNEGINNRRMYNLLGG